jgi:16S rRNA (cytosine967-C5)-methyltransferase
MPSPQRVPARHKAALNPARKPADPLRLAVLRAYLRFAAGGALEARPPPQAGAEAGRAYTRFLLGLVRHRRWLEAEVGRLAKRPLAKLDPPVTAAAMLGLLQLHVLRLPEHAVVYETVQAVAALGYGSAKGLVNSLLRAALRERAAGCDPRAGYPLAIRTSHPDWLVERWTRHYGAERAQAICEANARFEAQSVRVETGRIARVALLERLAAEGVKAEPHGLLPTAILVPRLGELLRSTAFAEGLCTVQDAASQLLTLWVAPLLRGRVLDACTAPGGKLTHLAGLGRADLWLAGADRDPQRLRRASENQARLRQRPVPLLAADGRHLPFRGGAWDAVLLDVPCSATGMIRKYPELGWRKHAADLPRYAAIQAGLLAEAARVTRPGGLIVYSTCSLEPEENEQQVQAFLARHHEWRPLPFTAIPPPEGLGEPAASLLTPGGYLRVFPAADRLGLFAAVLHRERTGF